jgi:hypothetical protein
MVGYARQYFRRVSDDEFKRISSADLRPPPRLLRDGSVNPGWQGYEELRHLTTFSSDIARAAGPVHAYLAAISAADVARLTPAQRAVIRAYSMNSEPFHQITRGLGLRDSYENMDDETRRRYFRDRDTGRETVRQLEEALKVMSHTHYNVDNWTTDYSGRMAFRGAHVGLPNDGGRVVYSSDGTGMIGVGSIVTNTDFMSTSARPQVGTEFVLRQMDVPHGPRGNHGPPTLDDIDEARRRGHEARVRQGRISDNEYRIGDHLARNQNRVIFRFDHVSGRNICALTAEKQAEILFPTRCLFEVRGITADPGGLGTIVDLVEIDPAKHCSRGPVRNIMTGHEVR